MTASGIQPGVFRLPEATRLGQVHLQVADLERSLAYYGEVLGFRVLDRIPGKATLAAQGADDTPLIALHEHRGAAPVPHRGRLGLYHYAILLPDRASLGRFVAHLGAIGVRAGASDHLVSEALYLQDPDGLGIEVYADRPRETWRYEALGFDKVVWNYPGALFLSAGGYHHHLGVNSWAGAGAASPRKGDAQLLEWEIVVPRPEDAEAAGRSLEAAGHGITRVEHGWLATDPWGTSLRLRSAEGTI